MKKLTIFTFIFFLAFVNNALAHTGLKSSSPQDGEIINEELQQVTLTFETKIEQGSTFELHNSNGETQLIENISLSENQMVGEILDPLENDEYQVNWKIIGADGHPIEGEFLFSVDVPVNEAINETPTEEQAKPIEESQPEPKIEKNEVDTVNETEEKEIQQSNTPSYVVPTIIGILIVIVVGSFLMMMKRKK